ncbi:hypothetical protein QZH41_001373 [Actinostola sp. cb2023]|nr:hypothetical protein QZH41_001373 [Actinostola sp. cb2023]
MEDSESLIMYAKSLPSYWAETWKTFFFFDAVTVQAFTNTRVTLSMVKEKASDFEFAAKQCSVIKSPKACSNSALLEQYKLLKDMQYNKNKDVKLKDLRKHSQMDYAQMMKLQKDNLQQLQLLGGIKKLDDNLQASVSGISKYFEGLAKFDQGIATADAGFLKGELDKYETSLKTVESKLKKDINEAMRLMGAVLAANLLMEIAKLVALVATNSNPLKLIFAGPDISDIMDQTGKVADATSNLVKGAALIVALDDLTQHSLKLRAAFGANTIQITSLQSIANKIRNGQSNDIGKDADKFVDEYGSYTPQTDRATLAKNDALKTPHVMC